MDPSFSPSATPKREQLESNFLRWSMRWSLDDAPCLQQRLEFLGSLPYRPAGIVPLPKVLRFDTADFPAVVGKTEGMALLGDGALVIINDGDFGISGGRTQIVIVRGTGIARR